MMAAFASDVIASPVSSICEGNSIDGHSQVQSVESSMTSGLASTPFPVCPADSEDLDKTSTVRDRRSSRSASAGARLRVASSSSSGSRPRSILISTDPVIQITPADETRTRDSSPESYPSPSPSSSEGDSPRSSTNDSSRTTLSSGFGADSAASSTRTRATTLCSTSVSPCVTFAPLPELGPRKRRSSRPLGIAARGQILRQRRMMMAQDKLSYYDDSVDTSIPFNRPPGGKGKEANEKARRDDLEDTEIALAALGKMLGEVTKNIWQRVAHSKAKDASGSKPSPNRPKPSRGLTWPGRLRSKTSPRSSGIDSDNDSDDEIDGPWSRRRDEDPMTKTIMEGSDDGLEHFVLQYDAIPACEEEEEEFANARADEEMRTTVEVHLVKTSDGESSD